jgi:hypothetical protein
VWSAACGAGWREDPSTGRCYKILRSSLTYFNAEYECMANGGSLLAINSPQEQTYIDGKIDMCMRARRRISIKYRLK